MAGGPAGQNMSMAEMWNLGADMASGKYVAFLAGGLLPLPGWLDEMVRTFRDQPEVGLVGSQINLPEGIIWEAGGMMDEDGGACRLGCGANAFQPEFSYLREVDFCSAISFMVPEDFLCRAGMQTALVMLGSGRGAVVCRSPIGGAKGVL